MAAGHDLYGVLGVSPGASAEEIKAAYRRAAFAHHPDTNPEGGRSAQARFQEVQEAWGVLRDEGKRAQYDRMRQAGFSGSSAGFEEASGGGSNGFGTPWGQPSMDERDFEAAFDAWWKKKSEEFADFEERQYNRERMSAERMARAAAWELEKEEAQLNKARTERLKWRAEDARMQRHAGILRGFWQTHAGFTRGDAVVVGLFLAGTAGIAMAWRSHMVDVRLHQQQQQQAQQRPKQQQAGRVQAPTLPAAAAVAAAAAASAAESS